MLGFSDIHDEIHNKEDIRDRIMGSNIIIKEKVSVTGILGNPHTP
jgi:hypothetical protein